MSGRPLALAELTAADLGAPLLRFSDGRHLYETTGEAVGAGGMGSVWMLRRWALDALGDEPEPVVGKTYRPEYLIFVREDATERYRFRHFERVIDLLQQVAHPNVLPVLLVAPIADNYLMVSPLAGQSLLERLTSEQLSPYRRVRLLCDSLEGLQALHQLGVVHRDYTVYNVLTVGESAALFDFDLSVAPGLLPAEERSYSGYYRGSVSGSPDFSIAPELLDEVLAREPISPRIDVYSVGTALYALFTDDSIYGEVPDLPTIYHRIGEGIVHRRKSRIRYPETVPIELRPIIERCLEREPRNRYADAGEVMTALRQTLAVMADDTRERLRVRRTDFFATEVNRDRLGLVYRERPDESVTLDDVRRVESALGRHGYLLERSLGRVKGHPIYLALPDPELVATGRFAEENAYRKIVTAIDLTSRADAAAFVDNWLARIFPILHRVRQGHLTSLHKVSHEKDAGLLLLFSEYVDDPRFGSDLAAHDLSLEEVFSLALIVATSIARLHAEGLAHNNVKPRSLLFKGRRVAGRVQPMFVGLVEPSFAKAALGEDVRNLAQMILSSVRQPRLDALRPDVREVVSGLCARLALTAEGGAVPAPTIGDLILIVEDALAAIEPNFGVLRSAGGDLLGYADVLVRHSLYNRLFTLDVSDEA